MTNDFTALINRRVRNNGDVANAPREGVINNIKNDRWGAHAVIHWDAAEHVGWEDGEAVTVNEPVSVIPAHMIGKGRFTLIAAAA